jgi:short-subunit dehydrogenase
MQLKGKTVALTGASGGIGLALAERLLEAGARIIAIGRQAPAWGGTHLPADLSTMEGCEAAALKLAQTPPDILIHLAGQQYFGPAETQDPASLARLLQVNLYAPIRLTQAVLPSLKQKQGAVMFVSSTFGAIPFPHFASYSATKAGMKAFAEALRRELSPEGVPVIHVAPRGVDTLMNGPKVRALMQVTKSAMDHPDTVAAILIKALQEETPEIYIGFPEKLFVRINALLPRLVDKALGKDVVRAREILAYP